MAEILKLSKKTREAIKLELGIPNATEEEFTRAAHLFIIDCLVKFLNDEKEHWQAQKPSYLSDLETRYTNVLIENMNNMYDDEAFDFFDELIDKHYDILSKTLTVEELDDVIFNYDTAKPPIDGLIPVPHGSI